MENIVSVSSYLKLHSSGRVLTPVFSVSGVPYLWKDGVFYRAFEYIEDSYSLLVPSSEKHHEELGKALAGFEIALEGFDASVLHETIPHFHDTEWRLSQLVSSVEKDAVGRKGKALRFIDEILMEASYAKAYPFSARRVAHNDLKISNLLFSKKNDKAICLVDFDTLMKGYYDDDFADAARSSCSLTNEDENDLSKVGFSLDGFTSLSKGYFPKMRGALEDDEIEYMAYGIEKMSYELAIRFLVDYLEGDVYFKTDYPEHNLKRAECQFALFRDIKAKEKEIKDIIRLNVR